MNNTLIFLLFAPIILPFLGKAVFGREFTWLEVGMTVVVCGLVVSGVWYAGKFSKMADVEILNGEITGKQRDHGTYLESYECNCSTDSKGNRHCSTCYRRHYTVDWYATSTVGTINFDHEDSTSMLVYAMPDPIPYKNCILHEPASVESIFVNYVKAVPESLFNTNALGTAKNAWIPPYPRVHDFYKINRVLSDGAVTPDYAKDLNDRLNVTLKSLGSKKQVNIIVIFTKNLDPSYRLTVENSWIGGKQNDVIVMIGLDGKNISWTDVMTFAMNKNNEALRTTLRDDLKNLDTLPEASVLTSVITNDINTAFKRIHMEEFEYLESRIEPPMWVLILSFILSIGGTIGAIWWLSNNNEREYD